MRKLLPLMVCATLALGSCNKETEPTQSKPNATPVSVSFTSKLEEYQSRAQDGAFEEGDQISVFAFDGKKEQTNNSAYTYSGGKFKSETPIETAKALSYLAIYPYSADMGEEFDFEIPTDQSSDEEYHLADLKYAATEATASATPQLPFKHALSKIEIALEGVEGAQLTLHALSGVECNTSKELFLGSGSIEDITPSANGEDSYKAIVAPQTFRKGDRLATVIYRNHSYDWEMEEDVTLNSGFVYSCTATFDEATNTLKFEGDIKSWIKGNELNNGDAGIIKAVEIDLNKATANSLKVDVDAEAYSGNYFIGYATYVDFDYYHDGDAQQLAQTLINGKLDYQGQDFSTPDNICVFSGSQTVTIASLEEQTRYAVVVAGVNDEGKIITEVDLLDASTLAQPTLFEISEVESTSKTIKVAVDVDDFEGNYFFDYQSTSYYNSRFEDPSEWAADRINAVRSWGIANFSVVDNSYIFNGNAQIDLKNLKEGESYFVGAFGVDASGNITTEIATAILSTAGVELVGSVDIEVTATTTNNILLNATPSTEVDNYVVALINRYTYTSGLNEDKERIAEFLLDKFANESVDLTKVDNTYVFSGNQEISLKNKWAISPRRDYTIVAFGVDATGKRATDVTIEHCSTKITENLVDPIDGHLEITVRSVTSTSIFVDVDLFDNVGNYYLAIYDWKKYNSLLGGNPDVMAAVFMALELNVYGSSLDAPDGYYILNEPVKGLDLDEGWKTAPDTEYGVFAFGMDGTGYVTTDVAVAYCKTEPAESSDLAPMSSSAGRQMSVISPELIELCSRKALMPF